MILGRSEMRVLFRQHRFYQRGGNKGLDLEMIRTLKATARLTSRALPSSQCASHEPVYVFGIEAKSIAQRPDIRGGIGTGREGPKKKSPGLVTAV